MAEVTYICKRTVVSTKPVQPGKYCQLSVLDRLMEQNHLRIVYYYDTPQGRKTGEVIEKLRESLAEVLTCFPIMTGRLQRNEEGDWIIKCNDAGVRMVEARVNGSLDEWLMCVDSEKELKLVYWEEMFHNPYFWSTFYIQLTEFESRGVAIGLSCIHFLADLTCVNMFIRAWADITLHGIMIAPPFFHPLPRRILDNNSTGNKLGNELIGYYRSHIENPQAPITSTKYSTIALAFTEQKVRDCMDMARTNVLPNESNPCPFETLAALFWVSISKIKGKGLVDMSICFDARNVLGLDTGFFGNCTIYNKVGADFNSDEETSLSKAAKAINEAKSTNEVIMDLIEWLKQNNHKNFSPLMNSQSLMCANLESVNPYLAMFDDSFSPIRVSYYVEPVCGAGQVLVLPPAPGEGPLSRVVMVTLPESEIVHLCKDSLIMSFSPTISMIFNKHVASC